MRVFIVDLVPTEEQIAEVEAQVLPAQMIGGVEGQYVVAFDDNEYTKPDWLSLEDEINVPGNSICPNCGEPIR